MAVAVKNSSETASPGLLDRFPVASVMGVLGIYAALGVVFYAIPYMWWEALALPRTAVNYTLLVLIAGAAFVGLVGVGIRAVSNSGREGLKASVFVGFFWVLLALILASGVGSALESNGVNAEIGVPVSLGLLAVLLIVFGRLVASPGFEQRMIGIEHQGWFATDSFKRGQGARVRRGTMLGVLVLGGCGVYTLISHNTLTGGQTAWELAVPYATLAEITKPGDAEQLAAGGEALAANIQAGSRVSRETVTAVNQLLESDYVKIADGGDSTFKMGELVKREKFGEVEAKLKSEGKLPPLKGSPALVESVAYPRLMILPSVMFTLPALLFVLTLWVAFRLVNVPVFADFLIATEAEMNKVSWTTRKNLVTDTIVVLVTVVLLTTFLFVVDQVWAVVLTKVGVLQTPPPAKVDKNQEVPW
jgi:preprotein translocase SecE subunit